MSPTDLNMLASQIVKAGRYSLQSNRIAGDWIRAISLLPDGAEALRLILRDNIGGAGSYVADALWLKL